QRRNRSQGTARFHSSGLVERLKRFQIGRQWPPIQAKIRNSQDASRVSSDVDYADRQHVILILVSLYIHYGSVHKAVKAALSRAARSLREDQSRSYSEIGHKRLRYWQSIRTRKVRVGIVGAAHLHERAFGYACQLREALDPNLRH